MAILSMLRFDAISISFHWRFGIGQKKRRKKTNWKVLQLLPLAVILIIIIEKNIYNILRQRS